MRTKGLIHNQLRLNAKIKEVFGSKYSDWLDMATELRQSGYTYEQISKAFTKLGVPVSTSTVSVWMRSAQAA